MYPDVPGQSSPERPAARQPARALRQTLARLGLWALAAATFLAMSAYAIGGGEFFRRMLQLRTRAFTRIEESLQPPTQAEIAAAAARAVRDTASVMKEDKPPSASAAFIVTCILVTILLAITAFYVSGRRRRAPATR